MRVGQRRQCRLLAAVAASCVVLSSSVITASNGSSLRRSSPSSILEEEEQHEQSQVGTGGRAITNDHDPRELTDEEISFALETNRAREHNIFELAHTQSYGFFTDITEQSWHRMKQRTQSKPNHINPNQPMLYSEHPHMWYQLNWDTNFACPYERRIGGLGEGGWWVCHPDRIAEIAKDRHENKGGSKCLVYSVGGTGKFTFEESLREALGGDDTPCEIHIFDAQDFGPSLVDLPPNIHFHNWGIDSYPTAAVEGENIVPNPAAFAGRPTNIKSFKDTLKELGHDDGRHIIDLLKYDCDGCEWRTYQDWFNSNIDIRQILVQTHYVPNNANVFFGTLREQGYVTFHKDPDTWAAGGSCQDYSFLKLDKSFFT